MFALLTRRIVSRRPFLSHVACDGLSSLRSFAVTLCRSEFGLLNCRTAPSSKSRLPHAESGDSSSGRWGKTPCARAPSRSPTA